MAAVEDDVDDRFNDIDIESLLSRVERRPLTFHRKKKSVFIAPEFLVRLKGEETVDEGEDLTLNFKVTGVPRPTLRWFKDNEEVKDHPRLSVEEGEDGSYSLTVHQVNKGDEAAYRCKAENSEGSCSCCFFLSVKGKPKSPKKLGHKRTVSYPTMFSTIVEKVEEEETAGKEASKAPVSPLSHFYDSLTLKGRSTWPEFLGDWAFVNGTQKNRGGSTGSYTSTASVDSDSPCSGDPAGEDVIRIFADAEGWESDDVFLDPAAGEGHASDLAEAQNVVFYLQAPEPPRAHRVGTVPPDVDRAPEEAAARGEAAQLLTSSPAASSSSSSSRSLKPSGLQGEKDSTEERGGGRSISEGVSDRGGGAVSGGGESATLSPSVAGTVEVARARGGGKGSSTLSSSYSSSSSPPSGADASKNVIKAQKGNQQASSLGVAGENDASSSDAASFSSSLAASASSSSSSPLLPAKPGVSSAAHSVVPPGKTNPSVAAPALGKGPSAASANPTFPPTTGTEPSKKSLLAPAGGGPHHKGFSLSTGSTYASGKPVAVRGPLGALISSGGGDAAPKTTTTPSKSNSSGLTTRESVSSTQPTTAIKKNQNAGFSSASSGSAVKSPKVSPVSTASRSPTGAAASSARPGAVPPLIVTPDPNMSGNRERRWRQACAMCDCANTRDHVCCCSSTSGSSTSSGYSSGVDSAGTCTPIGESPFTPSLTMSDVSVLQPSPVTSQASSQLCPGLSPACSSLLLQPEYDREQREPTPIPPDRLIVTHTSTGSSVLVQMYKGPLRPPGVPPKESPCHFDNTAETEIVVPVDNFEDEEWEALYATKEVCLSSSSWRAEDAPKEAASLPARTKGAEKERAPPPPSRAKAAGLPFGEPTTAERHVHADAVAKTATSSGTRGEVGEAAHPPQKTKATDAGEAGGAAGSPQPKLTTTPTTPLPSVKKSETAAPMETPALARDESQKSAPLSSAARTLQPGTEALYFDPVRRELMHIVSDDNALGPAALKENPLFIKEPGETLFTRPLQKAEPGVEHRHVSEPKSQPHTQAEAKQNLQVKPEPKTEPAIKPEPKHEPAIKPEPKPEPAIKPEPKPEPAIKPEPKPEPAIKPEPKPEPAIKPEPKPEPEIKAEPKPEPKIKTEPKTEPQIKPEPKRQPQIEPEPEYNPQTKPEPKPELQIQPQLKRHTKVEFKVTSTIRTEPIFHPQIPGENRPRPDPQPQLRSVMKLQPQPIPQTQPQPRPQTQPQPTPQTQPQLQPTPQTQPQPRPQTQPQLQPTPQTQPQPRPQTQPQLQPTPQTQPQPTPQTQDRPPPQPQPHPNFDDELARWFVPAQQATTSTAPQSHLQMLYFDPAREELLHVKRACQDTEPGRSRSTSTLKSPTRGNRRSPTPARGKDHHPQQQQQQQQQQRARSAVNISSRPVVQLEEDFMDVYLNELVFLICLFTFLCLMLEISTPLFIGTIVGIHLVFRLGVYFSQRRSSGRSE